VKPVKKERCEFCERVLDLTYHHLIPKKTHKLRRIKERFSKCELNDNGVWLCVDCHKKIHKTFSHQELAFRYCTKDKLLENPEILKFVEWVKRQNRRVK